MSKGVFRRSYVKQSSGFGIILRAVGVERNFWPFQHRQQVLFLRGFLRKQEKRSGFGRCFADRIRWTNAFFADAGLFALHTAWQNARHSR